jgi:hypothetical protein
MPDAPFEPWTGRGAAITRRERRCGDVLSNQELLISGDRDLLALAGKTRFLIATPEAYRVRIFGAQDPIPS